MPVRVSSCFLLLTLFMFLFALQSVADLEGISAQSAPVVSEPERRRMLLAGTPHGPIAIDGDANFSDTALLEGWPGDGSPESPYIIDGLEIDLDGEIGYCISISNTRVSFTISNCNLTGASWEHWPIGAGIKLDNVMHSELAKNTLDGNHIGIIVINSHYNTVANNTCSSNNDYGITLDSSHFNTVSDNTCTRNYIGIYLRHSDFNTVANNICSTNTLYGIYLYIAHSNIVANSTCNNNKIGIYLLWSENNTVTHNTCLSNTEHDIYLDESDSNTVASNITTISEEFVYLVLLLIGFVGTILISAGWRKVSARGGLDNIIVPMQKPRRLLEARRKPPVRVSPDDLIVPTRYQLVSWLLKRRSLKHELVDKPLEPDSSDQ